METAQERALREAREFARKHPEFPVKPKKEEQSPWLRTDGQYSLEHLQTVTLDGAIEYQIATHQGHERSDEELAQAEEVREAMELLDPSYRELLERVFFLRQTYQEIADDTGVSRQAVHQRLQRAKEALRRELTEE